MSDVEFSVTNQPPTVTRRPGRKRGLNKFREGLEQSFDQKFKASDDWFEYRVDLDGVTDAEREVNRYVDRIRAAGQQEPKIGTEVRRDYATGVIAFRGVEYVARPRKASREG